MLYYIAASPLVKVFLPEWHDRLAEKPDLMFDMEEPFEFTISTGTRGIRVKFNTPQQIEGKNQRDNEAIYNWLTGGKDGTQNQETDIYGIVMFDPEMDLAQTYDQLQSLEDYISDDPKKVKEAKAKQDAMRKAAAEKIRTARERVRLASDARVRRAIKNNHRNLLKQWELNEEMKLGKHKPSMAEQLGMIAIDKEIQAAENKRAVITKRTQEIMGRTGAV